MMRTISLFLVLLFGGIQVEGRQAHPKNAKSPAYIKLNPGEHILCGKSHDGKIELEDGTQFKVISAEVEKVREEWSYHTTLALSTNPYPGGGSEFFLTNKKTGEYVHVNLEASPDPNDEYTLSIYFVDPFEGRIYLSNNNGTKTGWEIEKKDLSYMQHWNEHDRMIIGENSNWIERVRSSYPFVLINCEHATISYVRVKPL